MQILIKNLVGKTFALDIDKNDTVKSLKLKIGQVEDIPLEKQRLIFSARLLDDESTLSYFGIQADSTVHMVFPRSLCGGFQIFVKSLSGFLTTLEVELSDSIKIVKEMIEVKLDFIVDNQTLIFLGRRLENEKTLADYGVKEQSTLILIGRRSGGG